MPEPSPYWADEPIWTSKNNVHNPMLDHKGRVWLTSTVRPSAQSRRLQGGFEPSVGEGLPGRERRPPPRGLRPDDEEADAHRTCFGTHHLMFAEDANHTLWTSGGGQVIGWLNTKMFDETQDEMKSQGWTALIRDANGNGKRDAYVEPDQPLDPTKDQRIGGALYAVAPAPDGSIWGTQLGYPGAVIRLSPGANPPETAITEIYMPPADKGYSPRGGDVDRNGVYWAAMASGHMASFDRRKCKGPLNGPTATGLHCPEGWTLLHRAGAAVEGRDRIRQRRGQLLHLGRSVRHARSGAQHRRSTPATPPKRCWR